MSDCLEKEIKNKDNNFENKDNIPNKEPNDNIMNSPNNEKEAEINPEKRNIISKVKIPNWRICCCFCCARRFTNIRNVLLDEGMRIIMEKMDILYMFKKIIKEDKIQEKLDINNIQIDMSDECKQNIIKIYKNDG